MAEQNLPVVAAPENATLLARGAAAFGIDRLNWSKAQRQTRDRVAFLRAIFERNAREGEENPKENPWPDLSEAGLSDPEIWLAPYIEGCQRLDEIGPEKFDAALAALLPWDLSRKLEEQAPTHFATPAGSSIALDYASAEGPVLAARVQEFYGLSTHPSLEWPRADHPAFIVAGASADPDHPGPAWFLERLLGFGQGGHEGTLSPSSLAGRPRLGRPHHPRKTARDVKERHRGATTSGCGRPGRWRFR